VTVEIPQESPEQRIRRVLGDVEITRTDGITSYIQPEDLSSGKIFSFVRAEQKSLDKTKPDKKSTVWILTDVENGSDCEMIESAQLSKHLPKSGQVFYIRFNGVKVIDGGKRVNDFSFNVYTIKPKS
jgi:membrane glycosyltransferase